MTDKTSLGDRMKKYEDVPKMKLTPRMPTIIRIDGKAFHTYTRDFDKPADERLVYAFLDTAKELLNEVQGAKIAYTQSDEISLLINDYEMFETQPWFGKSVQKMASVAASAATAYFNKYMWANGVKKIGMFDARVFVLPREEVANYFLWRHQDCVRNSISSLAQSMFSTKELHGVNNTAMKEMTKDKGIDWDELPARQRFGSYIILENQTVIAKSCIFEAIKPKIEECLRQVES